MDNQTLHMAFQLANAAFQYYIQSDVCVKDLSYNEMYVNLKQLVNLLGNVTLLKIGR